MAESNSHVEEHTLVLLPSGRRGTVAHGSSLLEAARSLGVELESICGGRQTCGKCQVVVEEGPFPKHGITSVADHLSPVESVEAAYAAEHALAGRRLACAGRVLGDLLITVPEESQARKQVVAKAATDRVIEVDAAVRQVYVEVQPASMGSRGGDWERVQAALNEQWDLSEVSVEYPVLSELQPALRKGNGALTASIWQDRRVLRAQPGYAEGVYGLAVDIGSTTVVAHLADLRTGRLLATRAMMNPQVRYGEDLMSRVSYGMQEPQGVERMHRAILRALNELAAGAAAAAGINTDDILDMVVVGNTIMHHLFLGIDPLELGGAPFALAHSSPLDLKARDLGLDLHPAAQVHVLPCIAGHVGADHVAVLLAERPHAREGVSLVIDVGTNAEVSLGDRERILCASSPTGPAFEGAQISHGQRAAVGAIDRVRINRTTLEAEYKVIGYPDWIRPQEKLHLPKEAMATGICGSGIIEAVAEMLLAGVIRSDGRFSSDAADRSPWVRYQGKAAEYVLVDAERSASGKEIVITQNDVRAIQLAKAALYTGAKLLMGQRGVTAVERVVLAGAFGSYISPQHAMILGMIPDCDLEHVKAVGNAAGDGALIALLNRRRRAEAAELASMAEHVQIANHPDFQEEFVAALGIPHARDPFPHLEGLLPERLPAEVGGRRRSGRRNAAPQAR
ncbi:MAG TPA: ASKHA domain-containing protein [Anaerolineales bacterium]|nr:ASKHA domain-containing protein [Anaerolineales bacterium]